MQYKNRYFYYSILPCLLLLITIGVYVSGYNPPTQGPPYGNLPAPINAGLDPQTKAGNLTIEGNLTTGGLTMSAGAEANKILTTNASGVASWQTPAAGGLWAQTGDDIYYNNGNVGIGTTDPGAKLEIDGPNLTKLVAFPGQWTFSYKNDGSASPYGFNTTPGDPPLEDSLYLTSLEGSSRQAFYFGDGDPTENMFGISQQYGDGPWVPNFVVNHNGDVGIGTVTPHTKLDVAGTIKIGTQGLCNANTAGSIRYVPTKKVFEGCDGQTWNLMANIYPLVCGNDITFLYKGIVVTYGTVKNPTTGECWMDRNLGASQVATAYNDSAAYGDLFQWGRLDDGHQNCTSGLTTTLSDTDNPGHSSFIKAPDGSLDWRSPKNDNLWQRDGSINNPCPSGWRVPTRDEWEAEAATWTEMNRVGAASSILKLPTGGIRRHDTGELFVRGHEGHYWASDALTTSAGSYMIWSTGVSINASARARGDSIRCIQN